MSIVKESMGLREALSAWERNVAALTVNLVWTSVRGTIQTTEEPEVALIASIRRQITSFRPPIWASSSLRRDRMAVCTLLRMSTTTRLTSRIWIQMWRDPVQIKSPNLTAINEVVRVDPSPSVRRTSTRRTTYSRRWSWKTRLRICAALS